IETYGSRSPIYGFSARLAYRTTWLRGGGAILGQHWFSPTSGAFASDGSLWVTDRLNDLVRHLSRHGRFLGALPLRARRGSRRAGVHLLRPTGIAVGPGGHLEVADTGHRRVVVFSFHGRV